MHQQFIQQVASKVRNLDMEYKRLADKLLAKIDDIFEPTIKIKLGVN